METVYQARLTEKMMHLFLQPFPEMCVKKTGLCGPSREPSKEVSPEPARAPGGREKEISLKMSRSENRVADALQGRNCKRGYRDGFQRLARREGLVRARWTDDDQQGPKSKRRVQSLSKLMGSAGPSSVWDSKRPELGRRSGRKGEGSIPAGQGSLVLPALPLFQVPSVSAPCPPPRRACAYPLSQPK